MNIFSAIGPAQAIYEASLALWNCAVKRVIMLYTGVGDAACGGFPHAPIPNSHALYPRFRRRKWTPVESR